MFNSRHLDISGNLLTVGGVRSFDTVTARLGQLASHDFVGCIRNVQVNNVDLLKQKPIISNHTTEKCHRLKSVMCAVDTCQNGGTCIDEWGAVRCKCADGFMGQFCEKSKLLCDDETIVQKYNEIFPITCRIKSDIWS